MPGEYKRLGEILVESGVLTNLQLSVAVAAQLTSNRRLGEILVERGYATEDQIARCLADQYGYDYIDDPGVLTPEQSALELVGAELAIALKVLPVSAKEGTLECVIWDPIDVAVTDQLRLATGNRLRIAIAPKSRLENAILRAYSIERPVAAPSGGETTHATLPERYEPQETLRQTGSLLWVRALDTLLGRNVLLVGGREDDANNAHLKARCRLFAQTRHPSITGVLDYLSHNGWAWAVFEDVRGEPLDSILRTRGPRSLSQAAYVCSAVAEACDALLTNGWAHFITPENVWIDDRHVRLVPGATPPEAWSPILSSDPDNAVYAIGLLLGTSLLPTKDWQSAKLDWNAFDNVPSAMRDIFARCTDRGKPDRFAEPVQVASALRAYNWSGAVSSAKRQAVGTSGDRDALLDSITQRESERAPFWKRIFGLGRAA
jgi:hypothetical protein